MRKTICALLDEENEADLAENWLEKNKHLLSYVSDMNSCGCCCLMWDIEGPSDALKTLPENLSASSEWTRSITGITDHFYLIFESDKFFLSKKKYNSWKEIQSEFNDYAASLGPWCAEDTIDYLESEYPELSLQPSMLVIGLSSSNENVIELTSRT